MLVKDKRDWKKLDGNDSGNRRRKQLDLFSQSMQGEYEM